MAAVAQVSALAMVKCHLVILVFLLFYGLSASSLGGSPQHLPGNYSKDSKPDRITYQKYIRPHIPYVNAAIPKATHDRVRIVKYNVNMLLDLQGMDNIRRIKDDMSALGPTLAIFQEVPKPPELLRSTRPTGEDLQELIQPSGPFWNLMRDFSLKYYYFGSCMKASFGTVIASSLPIVASRFHQLDVVHGITFATFIFNNQRVGIFDAPLLNSAFEKSLHAYIGDMLTMFKIEYYFVSAKYGKSVSRTQFKSVFDSLTWRRPPFTSWQDVESDHIFCSPSAEPKLVGAYVYFTLASDSLPLVVDVHVPGAVIPDKYTLPRSTLFLSIFAIIFLTSITSFGVYHWVRSKLDPL